MSETRCDSCAQTMTIVVDYKAGCRFAHAETPEQHPVHDVQTKRYRHLNCFEHEYALDLRVPR